MELKVDKKTGRNILIAIFAVVIGYMWLHESERVSGIIDFVFGLFTPFVLGAAAAFILNVPMRFFERKLSFIKNEKVRRVVSMCVTFAAVIAVVTAFFVILIPQIKETIQVFALQLPGFFKRVDEWTDKMLYRYPQLKDFAYHNFPDIFADNGSINWMGLVNQVLTFFESSITDLATQVVAFVSDLFNAIYNGVFSLIFAFYCLARKETLARQARKLLYSLVAERRADEVVRVLRMSNTVFSNFITGQCLDAVILGIMCAAVMAVLKMPYIPLIFLIIVITALIPVMGALIGAVVAAFLIFVSSPIQAVIFVIMFIVVQQIDNNIVYPRVVGSSIGLPSMWVLVAVLVGQGLMGVAGMLLMVPLASVLYALLREFANKRLQQRNIPVEKVTCQPPELQQHFRFRRKQTQKKPEEATAEEVETN